MNDQNEITRTDVRRRENDSTSLQTRPGSVVKPRYESRYNEDSWEVSVALPGVRKGDVSVSIENEILDLAAIRRREAPEHSRPLADYPEERRYRLRLDVGPEVDPNGVDAGLEDGVLTLKLPLREEVKPRSIPVH